MDTRQLLHFLSVAEHGHFARAADAIHLSQPALSRSIQQLEAQLGVTLFDRGRHGATLTAFGKAALSHARTVLASTDALRQEMDGLRGLDRGRLNVGTGPYPAIGLMDRVSADFVHHYPGIELTLHTGNWQELRDRLLAGELELFVADTRELVQHPDLETVALPQQRGVLFCRPDHPLLSRPSLDWAALGDYPLAATRLPARVEAAMAALSNGQTGRRIQCDNVAMLVAIVQRSDAVSLAPLGAIDRQLDEGSLAVLDLPQTPELQTQYGLVQRRNRTLSPAARVFIDILGDQATALAAGSDRQK